MCHKLISTFDRGKALGRRNRNSHLYSSPSSSSSPSDFYAGVAAKTARRQRCDECRRDRETDGDTLTLKRRRRRRPADSDRDSTPARPDTHAHAHTRTQASKHTRVQTPQTDTHTHTRARVRQTGAKWGGETAGNRRNADVAADVVA